MPTIDAQQQSILRRRQLAQALQQMSMEPIAAPPMPGVKISPLEGIAKLVQAFAANRQNKRLDTEQSALSAQSDKDKLAQAMGMSNMVVPPSPGPVAPQPVEGQPVPELAPPAPATVQPPPGMDDQRTATRDALAKALASDNPQISQMGQMLAGKFINGTEAEKARASELAMALGNRDFQQQQQGRSEAFTGGENAANRANTQAVNLQDNATALEREKMAVQSAEKIAGLKPGAQDKEIDSFTNKDGYRVTTYQRPDNTTYERKGTEKVQPPAAVSNFNIANPTEKDQTVKYIADQVRDNPLNWNLTAGNKTLQNQVRQELASGSDVNRLTASTRQLGETADTIVPKIDSTMKLLDDPKIVASLGPAMGRWNEFLTGKYGSNDPQLAQLRSTLGLLQTGVMRAHVGARGGEGLLNKFEGLIDGKKMDAATLKGSLTGIRDFLQGYRDRIHPDGKSAPAAGGGLVLPDDIRQKLLGK